MFCNQYNVLYMFNRYADNFRGDDTYCSEVLVQRVAAVVVAPVANCIAVAVVSGFAQIAAVAFVVPFATVVETFDALLKVVLGIGFVVVDTDVVAALDLDWHDNRRRHPIQCFQPCIDFFADAVIALYYSFQH